MRRCVWRLTRPLCSREGETSHTPRIFDANDECRIPCLLGRCFPSQTRGCHFNGQSFPSVPNLRSPPRSGHDPIANRADIQNPDHAAARVRRPSRWPKSCPRSQRSDVDGACASQPVLSRRDGGAARYSSTSAAALRPLFRAPFMLDSNSRYSPAKKSPGTPGKPSAASE